MEAAIAEIQVPEKLEAAKQSAQTIFARLAEESQEIGHRIYVEESSIKELVEERSQITGRGPIDEVGMEKCRSIARRIEKSNEIISALSEELSAKRLKFPAAAAALRDAEMKINKILKAALLSQIASGETELAQMEESLRAETPALEALVEERRTASHAFSIGKEKREKVQQLGARISESQSHIAGMNSAIEPARAALATMRVELQDIDSKLSDAQALNQIDGIKERGERVAETIRKKLKEASEALDLLLAIKAELKPFMPYQIPRREQSEVNIAAEKCGDQIISYQRDMRDAAREIVEA